MSYNPTTDFIGLLRLVGSGVRSGTDAGGSIGLFSGLYAWAL